MNKKVIIVVVVLILAGLVFHFTRYKKDSELYPSASVSTSPYASATADSATLGWKTFSNNNYQFKYPGSLAAKYISTSSWPPVLSVSRANFNCAATSGKTPNSDALPSDLNLVNVEGRMYCVETTSEGAAGSTYVTYNFTTQKGANLVGIKFTLRYPQCDNYDDPAKTACKNERSSFDLNKIVDLISQSVVIKQAQ